MAFLGVSAIISVLLVLILIITLVCGCMHTKTTIELYANNTNVNYVDDDTFAKAITLSSFFRNLSSIDLYARGNASSQEEYVTTYFSSKIPFTDSEKDILDKCITRANNILIDFPKIQQTPWNFAKVHSSIENGFPHTLGNIIVLSERVFTYSIEDLTKTLIHEKIHVVQRTYPFDFIHLYDKIGFKKTKDISRHDLARANPDIDNYLYVYEKTHQVPMQLYTSKYPSSIAESVAKLVMFDGSSEEATPRALGLPQDIRCQLEHPNEITACLIAEMLTSNDKSFIEKNATLYTIWIWMLQNWK